MEDKKVLDFYEKLAGQYHLIFQDWEQSSEWQGNALSSFIKQLKPDTKTILDCSCGIGTQALPLAEIGYKLHASDISHESVEKLRQEAQRRDLSLTSSVSDFRSLSETIDGLFDVVLSCDNALPHMLTDKDTLDALENMKAMLSDGGL